jgi:hypothetical protein
MLNIIFFSDADTFLVDSEWGTIHLTPETEPFERPKARQNPQATEPDICGYSDGWIRGFNPKFVI